MSMPLAVLPATRRIDVTVRYCPQDAAVAVSEDLSDAWAYPFEFAEPIRALLSFKGQRNFTGAWWCATTKSHVGFESWVERDQLMAMDHDPHVVGIASQPFEIELETASGSRRHVPDYFVRRDDGAGVVVDIRPDELVKPLDEMVFKATAEACGLVGWTYRRIGVAPQVQTANLRWLAGYRHPRNAGPSDAWDALREALVDGPLPIAVLADRTGRPRIVALPWIFHRLWTREVSASLTTQRLSLASLVALNGALE